MSNDNSTERVDARAPHKKDPTDECLRRFDLLRWELQDIHRDLERLGDLVKETHTIARDIQMELDDMVREGVFK